MLDIAILGNTGTYPLPGRQLSQMYIQYEGHGVLVDCGEGTMVQLIAAGIQPQPIDQILITHMHGDHTFGLLGLVQTMDLLDRKKPLRIYGEKYCINKIQALLRAVNTRFKIEYIVIDESNKNSVIKHKDLTISAIKLKHNAVTYGYVFNVNRLAKFDKDKAIRNNIPVEYWRQLQHGNKVIDKAGRVINPQDVLGESRQGLKVVYATDTRPCDQLLGEQLKNPDLLIIESMYINEIDKAIQNKHLTLEEQINIAKTLDAKQTKLVHIAPQIEPNQIQYMLNKAGLSNRVQVAKPIEKISLGYTD